MAAPAPHLLCSVCGSDDEGTEGWTRDVFGHELLCTWCSNLLHRAEWRGSDAEIKRNLAAYKQDRDRVVPHVNAVRKAFNARNGWTSKNGLKLFRVSPPPSLPNLEGRSERDREFLGPG